jgi:hypothetical protein
MLQLWGADGEHSQVDDPVMEPTGNGVGYTGATKDEVDHERKRACE